MNLPIEVELGKAESEEESRELLASEYVLPLEVWTYRLR
jgi:hypothetical protein